MIAAARAGPGPTDRARGAPRERLVDLEPGLGKQLGTRTRRRSGPQLQDDKRIVSSPCADLR
eukprot:15467193-Alexandrium_andersonii.AAC.1